MVHRSFPPPQPAMKLPTRSSSPRRPCSQSWSTATVVTGLPEEYQSMTSSTAKGCPAWASPDGDVEQRLATHRHVALGPELPAVAPLAFQEANHLGEVKSGGHDAEA